MVTGAYLGPWFKGNCYNGFNRFTMGTLVSLAFGYFCLYFIGSAALVEFLMIAG